MKKASYPRMIIILLCVVCLAATSNKVKNVLIIGDSISIGYTPFVQKALAPAINVSHNPGNGGSTIRGVDSLEVWLGNKEWDMVLFNFGLHDLAHKDAKNKNDINGKVSVTLDQYRTNLEKIAARLKKTKAKIVFITTTVVPENSPGRKAEDPAKYNQVALEVMKKHGIQVIDLYTASQTIHPQNSKPGDVHYTQAGSELLAAPLISTIRTILQK